MGSCGATGGGVEAATAVGAVAVSSVGAGETLEGRVDGTTVVLTLVSPIGRGPPARGAVPAPTRSGRVMSGCGETPIGRWVVVVVIVVVGPMGSVPGETPRAMGRVVTLVPRGAGLRVDTPPMGEVEGVTGPVFGLAVSVVGLTAPVEGLTTPVAVAAAPGSRPSAELRNGPIGSMAVGDGPVAVAELFALIVSPLETSVVVTVVVTVPPVASPVVPGSLGVEV